MKEQRRHSRIKLAVQLPFFVLALAAVPCGLIMLFRRPTEIQVLITWVLFMILLVLIPVLGFGLYDTFRNLCEVHDFETDCKNGVPPERSAFYADARKQTVISCEKTFLTPEFIMTAGQFRTYLPLRDLTRLEIEPHADRHPHLLLKAYTAKGGDARLYRVDCRYPIKFRETAAAITECIYSNVPHCQIISPYLEEPQMMQTF